MNKNAAICEGICVRNFHVIESIECAENQDNSSNLELRNEQQANEGIYDESKRSIPITDRELEQNALVFGECFVPNIGVKHKGMMRNE
jgi:hypothetical protein